MWRLRVEYICLYITQSPLKNSPYKIIKKYYFPEICLPGALLFDMREAISQCSDDQMAIIKFFGAYLPLLRGTAGYRLRKPLGLSECADSRHRLFCLASPDAPTKKKSKNLRSLLAPEVFLCCA